MPSEMHHQTGEGAPFLHRTMKWAAPLWFAIASAGAAIAETAPTFHLCSSYLQQSAMGERTSSGWPIFVRLTKLGARRFEAFAEANAGAPVRVVVDGREFLRATLQAPMSGGSLQGHFHSQEEAAAWRRTLAGDLPSEPCGMQEQKGR